MRNLVLITTVLLVGCKVQFPQGITDLSVDNYAQVLSKEATLVDVRTAEECSEAHMANADNVDYFNEDFAKDIQVYNTKKPIYIYCRSGKRSAKAAMVMDSLGFKYIVNLKGGLLAWMDAKRPVVEE